MHVGGPTYAPKVGRGRTGGRFANRRLVNLCFICNRGTVTCVSFNEREAGLPAEGWGGKYGETDARLAGWLAGQAVGANPGRPVVGGMSWRAGGHVGACVTDADAC